MSDPIMQKLDELQALCDAATEGPWREHSFDLAGEDEPPAIVIHTGEFIWRDPYEGRFLFSTPGADSQEWNDAKLTTAARTDMPRLIAALKAVMEDHYPNGVDHDCDCCPPVCACGYWEYPCPTVKAIAKALGVES